MKRFGKKLITKNEKARNLNLNNGYNEFYIDTAFVYQITLLIYTNYKNNSPYYSNIGMQKGQPTIKLISLQTKGSNSQQTRIAELQQQLQQAHFQIQDLRSTNQSLIDQITIYEKKVSGLNLINEQLQFRREQERSMQEHIDNYQQINAKLRKQINELEESLRGKELDNKLHSISTYQKSELCEESRKSLSNAYFDDPKLEVTGRRSFGQSQKQNHPITPKNRVSINLDNFVKNELDSLHQIKVRRKVFM